MTKRTHTPGPWTAGEGDREFPIYIHPITFDAGEGLVCVVAKPRADGNARLIAAAPDLLAALQTIADRRPCWCGTMRDGGRCNSCIAIKAIEQATAIRRAN